MRAERFVQGIHNLDLDRLLFRPNTPGRTNQSTNSAIKNLCFIINITPAIGQTSQVEYSAPSLVTATKLLIRVR
jgi:hypothetical protein